MGQSQHSAWQPQNQIRWVDMGCCWMTAVDTDGSAKGAQTPKAGQRTVGQYLFKLVVHLFICLVVGWGNLTSTDMFHLESIATTPMRLGAVIDSSSNDIGAYRVSAFYCRHTPRNRNAGVSSIWAPALSFQWMTYCIKFETMPSGRL